MTLLLCQVALYQLLEENHEHIEMKVSIIIKFVPFSPFKYDEDVGSC